MYTRLNKLRCEALHLETLWRFLYPLMGQRLNETLHNTRLAIKDTVQSLATLEARSLATTTPLPHLTPSGIEDYAGVAVGQLLSYSAGSVRPHSFRCLMLKWFIFSETAEIKQLRRSLDDLRETELSTRISRRLLSDASGRVGEQHYSMVGEIADLEYQLACSLGGSKPPSSSEDVKSSARQAVPPEIADLILSYMPRDSWGARNFRLRSFYPLCQVYVLHVERTPIRQIGRVDDHPTMDFEVYAKAIRRNPEASFLENAFDLAEPFVLEKYIAKLETLSRLGKRIKHFDLCLKTERQTFLPLIKAAGRCFWYPKVLAVEASDAWEDDDNIHLEDDTLREVTDALKANVPRTDLPTPKDVTLTGPLLLSFMDAKLLRSVTRLTLTTSRSRFHLPQAITAVLPALRDLDLYGLNYRLGQPMIDLGSISTLRIPSLSFLEYCRFSYDVRYHGIRVRPGFLGRKKLEWFRSRLSTTFPLVDELETVSLANTGL